MQESKTEAEKSNDATKHIGFDKQDLREIDDIIALIQITKHIKKWNSYKISPSDCLDAIGSIVYARGSYNNKGAENV